MRWDGLTWCILQEKSIKAELEKLRKQHNSQKHRLEKQLQMEREKRFPVKESLIAQVDPSGPPLKTLPVGVLHMDTLLPADCVPDAMLVWDFVNNFRYVSSLMTHSAL